MDATRLKQFSSFSEKLSFSSSINEEVKASIFIPSRHFSAFHKSKTNVNPVKSSCRNTTCSFFSNSSIGKSSIENHVERNPLFKTSSIRPKNRDEILRWRGFDQWILPELPKALLKDNAELERDVAEIIDGKAISLQIREEIAEEVKEMKEKVGQVPGLAVVLVGNRKDSQTYVRSKKKACEQAGIFSLGVELPEDSSEEDVLDAVARLNADPRVHGVLVQLPLPKHMNEEKILSCVSVEKDVDGFHPLNMGKLAMAGREPLFVPCTPKGCIELLLRSGIDIERKKAVVIGRSNVVGMPAALLLQRYDATVTVVHSRTPDPIEITRQADIVIAAAGVPNLVRQAWLKPGCVVIDVGINAVEDASDKRGYRLVGDVCYDEAKYVASAITPVPGGVGPMTISMLLSNTLLSAKRTYGLERS